MTTPDPSEPTSPDIIYVERDLPHLRQAARRQARPLRRRVSEEGSAKHRDETRARARARGRGGRARRVTEKCEPDGVWEDSEHLQSARSAATRS